MLHDDPQLSNPSQMNGAGETSAEKKKAARKAKKEAEKAEAERKAKAAKQPQPKPDEDGVAKKEDPDPQGLELIKTDKPLEDAMKFLTPILELSPRSVEGQVAGFEIYIRRSESSMPTNILQLTNNTVPRKISPRPEMSSYAPSARTEPSEVS